MWLQICSSPFFFWVREKSLTWCIKLKYTALRIIVLVFVVVILLWLSIFLYGSFYFTYMPSVLHLKPVHFQFSKTCGRKHMCGFPSANVSLLKEDGEGVLKLGQNYKIYLDLDMPESPVNQKLGMFMVKINILSHNELIRTSHRATMLRYKSHFFQMIQALIIAPLAIFGTAEEKQLVDVNLFDNYMEDPYKTSRYAVIEIQAYDIEIYSAILRIHAHFSGLRYLLFNHPFIAFILGVGTNMIFLTAIALLSWYHCAWGREHEEFLIRTISPSTSQTGNTLLMERQLIARQLLSDERRRDESEIFPERENDGSEGTVVDKMRDSSISTTCEGPESEQINSTPLEAASVFALSDINVLRRSENHDESSDSQETFVTVQKHEIPSFEQVTSELRLRHTS